MALDDRGNPSPGDRTAISFTAGGPLEQPPAAYAFSDAEDRMPHVQTITSSIDNQAFTARISEARAGSASPEVENLQEWFAVHRGDASGFGGSEWDTPGWSPSRRAEALDFVLTLLDDRLSLPFLEEGLDGMQ
jgi:hypothetical protein